MRCIICTLASTYSQAYSPHLHRSNRQNTCTRFPFSHLPQRFPPIRQRHGQRPHRYACCPSLQPAHLVTPIMHHLAHYIRNHSSIFPCIIDAVTVPIDVPVGCPPGHKTSNETSCGYEYPGDTCPSFAPAVKCSTTADCDAVDPTPTCRGKAVTCMKGICSSGVAGETEACPCCSRSLPPS